MSDPQQLVVIGSGIGAISCVEELFRLQELGYGVETCVSLVTDSEMVRTAVIQEQITRYVSTMGITQTESTTLQQRFPKLRIINTKVTSVDPTTKRLTCQNGATIAFDKLCICTGARPHLLRENHPLVIGIRDTESVEVLKSRLQKSRRILVVGNGGVAMELVEALSNVQVVWVIKHAYIGNTFLDGSASQFLLPKLERIHSVLKHNQPQQQQQQQQQRVTEPDNSSSSCLIMDRPRRLASTSHSRMQLPALSALGPEWTQHLTDVVIPTDDNSSTCTLQPLSLEFNAEVVSIEDTDLKDNEWPLRVTLTTGSEYLCDLVVCAIGVIPNTDFVRDSLDCAQDGGILVDEDLATTKYPFIYAVGDCCAVTFQRDNWFQMRLWSQARAMGRRVAQSMYHCAAQESGLEFELFTHATHFFGYKVVLLGLFNGQTLQLDQEQLIKQMIQTTSSLDQHSRDTVQMALPVGSDVEVLVRETPEVEYIKVVVVDGRVRSAMLIGETGLEDTMENLILNQLDISAISKHLLDPDVDIEDFFD